MRSAWITGCDLFGSQTIQEVKLRASLRAVGEFMERLSI